MNQDEEHLRLLSIFHYVVAGISALYIFFILLWMTFGFAFLSLHADPGQHAPPPEIKWIVIVFGTFGILWWLAYAILTCLAGRYLAQRSHYLFCLVMAGIACMFMPFGTALGVFSLIVLTRDSVKGLFGVIKSSS